MNIYNDEIKTDLDLIKYDLETNSHQLIDHIKKLTTNLYKNQIVLYYPTFNGDLIKSQITLKLLDYDFNETTIQNQRDILRLISIILKTNKTILQQAQKSDKFIRYLSQILNNDSTWTDIEGFKYQISVASIVVMSDETLNNFEYENIRRKVMQRMSILSQQVLENYEKYMKICMVFYACSLYQSNYHLVRTTEIENQTNKKLLNKAILGSFNDLIRDYITNNFIAFYKNSKDVMKSMEFFCLKKEFTFTQICFTIFFFSKQSDKIRLNILESGFYENLSQIFLLENLPENLTMIALKSIEIALLDDRVKQYLRNHKTNLYVRLNYAKRNYNHHLSIVEKVNEIIDKLNLKIDETSDRSGESSNKNSIESSSRQLTSNESSNNLNNITNNNNNNNVNNNVNNNNNNNPFDLNKTFNCYCIRNWNHVDVEKWLLENNLDCLRDQFSNLTGRGLRIFLRLLNETNGRINLINLLMENAKLDFCNAVEFVGALEDLLI